MAIWVVMWMSWPSWTPIAQEGKLKAPTVYIYVGKSIVNVKVEGQGHKVKQTSWSRSGSCRVSSTYSVLYLFFTDYDAAYQCMYWDTFMNN